MPILNRARAVPMVRTILRPSKFSWWPKTCSTRARTSERAVFASFWRSVSGRAAHTPQMHAALQALRGQASLRSRPSDRRCRPDRPAGVVGVEISSSFWLSCTPASVTSHFADELVRLVDADVVLVAVVALARASSSSARPCPSGHSWRASAPSPPAFHRP